MCCHTEPEVSDASQINGEGTAPHKGKNSHDKHSAGGVRDMPQWVFTGIENVLIGVVNP